MLTKRYLAATKSLPEIMNQIRKGTAPSNFNTAHLQGLGFTSSNDRGVIPLLKDLGFLTESGVPTERYHAYRDESRSRAVLGEAIQEAYQELFHVNARPTDRDREAIKGKFKATHNATDRVAEQQTATFLALMRLADIDAARAGRGATHSSPNKVAPVDQERQVDKPATRTPPLEVGLRYNIEVHLPATKDIEVYNAIFKSLKEHLVV